MRSEPRVREAATAAVGSTLELAPPSARSIERPANTGRVATADRSGVRWKIQSETSGLGLRYQQHHRIRRHVLPAALQSWRGSSALGFEGDWTDVQTACFENPASQTATPFHEVLGAWFPACPIHPIARPTFLRAFKEHSIDAKANSDQSVEIDAGKHHVAAEGGRRQIRIRGVVADRLHDGEIEQGDLALVVGSPIEEPVTGNTTMSHQFDRLPFLDRMFAGGLTVTAEVIVAGGNEEVMDGGRHFGSGDAERGLKAPASEFRTCSSIRH